MICLIICVPARKMKITLNFFEPKDNPSEEEYKQCIFHEEIHGIQSIIYGEQPEWLTEGVAKYLDGTYSKGIKWLNMLIKNQFLLCMN